MKILLLTTWRLINAKGGAEKVFCDMANALTNRGHEVTAVCVDKNQGSLGFPLDRNVNFLNIYQNAVPLPLRPLPIKLQAFLHWTQAKRKSKKEELTDLSIAHKLRSALLAQKFDIAVAFQVRSCLILRTVFDDTLPIATMLHNVPNSYFNEQTPQRHFEIGHATDIVQVLRPEYTRELRAFLPEANIAYIPNSVPQVQETAELAAKTIINVARISQEKQQLLLIEAFGLLKNEFPDWTIELWGETNYKPNLTKKLMHKIVASGLNERFTLCGTTNHIKKKLLSASIFAFPSKHEGFPLALTEAMSLGLPAVGCKDCSGVNTLIKDGKNGLLCDPTAESLAEALRKLMRDQDLRRRLGAQAKEDMKEFAPERVWDQWEDLLTELVEKHRKH